MTPEWSREPYDSPVILCKGQLNKIVYLHDAVLVSPLDHIAVRLVSGRATRSEGILEGYRGLLNMKEEYY